MGSMSRTAIKFVMLHVVQSVKKCKQKSEEKSRRRRLCGFPVSTAIDMIDAGHCLQVHSAKCDFLKTSWTKRLLHDNGGTGHVWWQTVGLRRSPGPSKKPCFDWNTCLCHCHSGDSKPFAVTRRGSCWVGRMRDVMFTTVTETRQETTYTAQSESACGTVLIFAAALVW